MFKSVKRAFTSACCFVIASYMFVANVSVYAQNVHAGEKSDSPAYKVLNTCKYEDREAVVTVYEHVQSGAHVVHYKNTDIDRGVGIAYKTYADDDTGVNHILEHCVCAGSSKYDDTNLLFDVMGKTSHTYLNAMTDQEFTVYLASSLFESQVIKFAEMFLNCTLYPKFLEDQRIFLREAFRIMLESVDSELKINGTVLNEMTDAYTKGNRYLIFRMINSLLNGRRYYDSGGNPEVIPSVTYEQLKATWEKYYHPSNCVVFLYGDLDTERFLNFFDKNFWCNYEKKSFNFHQDKLELIKGKVEREIHFPSSKDSRDTGLGNFYQIYHGDIDESKYTANDYSSLAQAFNHKDSPFIKMMREKLPDVPARVVCEEINGKMGFIFSATDINIQSKQIFADIVANAIKEVQETGFSPAVLKTFDDNTPAKRCYDVFKRKSGRKDIGMAYIFASLRLWTLEDGWDWINKLEVDTHFDIKKIPQILSELTDPAEGYAFITALPRVGMIEEKNKEIAEKLEEMKKAMTEQQLNQLVNFTNYMSAWLKQGGNPHAYKEIADADIDTLKFDMNVKQSTIKTQDGIKLVSRNMDKLPEISANILSFGTKHLSKEERRLAGTALGLAFNVGTNAHDVGQLSSIIYDEFYKVGTQMGKDRKDDDDYTTADISWIGLADECENMLNLVKEIIMDIKFSDVDAIKSYITRDKKRVFMALAKCPEIVATNRGIRYLKAKDTYPAFGNLLETYQFLCRLEEDINNAPTETIQKMKEVLLKLACSDDVTLYLSSNEECCEKTERLVSDFVKTLQNNCLQFKNNNILSDDSKIYKAEYFKKEAFISDGAGSSNGAVAICPEGIEYDAKLQVLGRILQNEYLLRQIRDSLGAYGCSISFNQYMVLSSNSDPNIEKTFDVFRGMATWLDSFDLTQEMLDSYKLKICTDIIKYLDKDSWSGGALFPVRRGRDEEYMKKMLDIIKGVTIEDIKGLSGELQKMVDNAYWYSVGDTKKITANEKFFENVVDFSKFK